MKICLQKLESSEDPFDPFMEDALVYGDEKTHTRDALTYGNC
jgi:hypothetical protein